MLHYSILGEGTPRLSFIHGFTQTSQSWMHPASGLVHGTKMFIDAPDHGESQGTSLNLVEAGNAVAEIANGSTLIGYSMGARIALHAVLQHPDAFDGVVIISGTAGIANEHDRQKRTDEDEARARLIEEQGNESFIRDWVRQPLFAHSVVTENEITDRLRNSASSLASSLRLCGTGNQQPLWDQLRTIHIPALLVAGALDAKFVDLAEQMHKLIPTSHISIVPNAGHPVHTEAPEKFCEVVSDWLDSQTNRKQ